MINVDKKTITIVILSLVIILLVWFIFSGNGKAQLAISEIREQRNELQRTNEIIESENLKIRAESAGLEKDNIEAEQQNNEYRQLIDDLRRIQAQEGKDNRAYGEINSDLSDFIEQNKYTE